ncbi:MAG TPA: 16S rRNA (cytosine(967)-C(5))-methyltransferase RsmB [Porticoccaceae bacterium]|nr:16S rRNA (cytosine(967)-C(5))-methyltransferase RsmB [Porticoccaceae bacterium]
MTPEPGALRAAAARVLAAVCAGQSLDAALPIEAERTPVRDRPLLAELCYGTLRWFPRLTAVVEHLLSRPLKERDGDLRALLAAALYQLEFTRIPPHAVVHESVAACQALGKPWAKGLVNALLRRVQRERAALDAALADDLGYRTAHPRWLARMLAADWPEQAEHIMAANNGRAPMTLRSNRRRGDRAAYLAQLAAAGIAATATAHSDDGVTLAAPCAVTELPGFGDGLASVQDEAAQLCAPLLAPHAGQRVLDACCAPGGKTGHLLELAPDCAELVAIDQSAERLDQVRENLDRLGLHARLLAADAGAPETWWDGVPFDRILLDAPCSAIGVLRRHPDIKLLRRAADIDQLAATQRRLLLALWDTLAPGGRLLYATCSVLRAENDAVVSALLEARGAVRVLPLPVTLPGIATRFGRQWLPGMDDNDGFYYALLEKDRGNAASG